MAASSLETPWRASWMRWLLCRPSKKELGGKRTAGVSAREGRQTGVEWADISMVMNR